MDRFINFINQSNEINNQQFNIQIFENLIENIVSDIRIDNSQTDNATSSEFINSLEEIDVTKDNISCSICLEDFKKGDKYIKLPCKDNPHYFHKGNDNCPGIINWLQKSNTCPICRHEFPKNEPEPRIIQNIGRINIYNQEDNEVIDNTNTEQNNPVVNRGSIIFGPRIINNILEREEERQINLAIQESLRNN